MCFAKQLPAALFAHIPSGIEFRRQQGNDATGEGLGQVELRDHERPFPWCIGFVPLGKATGKLDEDYLTVVHALRSSGHDANWFENHVVKPTRAHATTWRRLFSSWRREYGSPRGPVTRLTVDVGSLTAHLDEQPYSLPTELSALFLEQLLQRPGSWVSSREMGKSCPELDGTRLDRLMRQLPGPIRSLIESKPGTGYRLRTVVDE